MPSLTIEQAYEIGLQNLRSGRPADAESMFRQILIYKPDHPDALHNLGLSRIVPAMRRRPSTCSGGPSRPTRARAAYHANLALALANTGQVEPAIEEFRKSIELQPDLADAHFNLALLLKAEGKVDEAILSYRNALAHQPDFPDALNNLGNTLLERGQVAEATDLLRRALVLRPDFPEAAGNLENARQMQEQYDRAIAASKAGEPPTESLIDV